MSYTKVLINNYFLQVFFFSFSFLWNMFIFHIYEYSS